MRPSLFQLVIFLVKYSSDSTKVLSAILISGELIAPYFAMHFMLMFVAFFFAALLPIISAQQPSNVLVSASISRNISVNGWPPNLPYLIKVDEDLFVNITWKGRPAKRAMWNSIKDSMAFIIENVGKDPEFGLEWFGNYWLSSTSIRVRFWRTLRIDLPDISRTDIAKILTTIQTFFFDLGDQPTELRAWIEKGGGEAASMILDWYPPEHGDWPTAPWSSALFPESPKASKLETLEIFSYGQEIEASRTGVFQDSFELLWQDIRDERREMKVFQEPRTWSRSPVSLIVEYPPGSSSMEMSFAKLDAVLHFIWVSVYLRNWEPKGFAAFLRLGESISAKILFLVIDLDSERDVRIER